MRPRVTLQLPSRPLCTPQALSGLHLLLLGRGYVANALRNHPVLQDMTVQWTTRNTEPLQQGALHFGSSAMRKAAERADFILSSIPPLRDGSDPALDAIQGLSLRARWVGYLSATSVYGNREGQWAFEGEAPSPTLPRGQRRADAELHWLEAVPQTQIFRLAAIYGPGRNPFAKLRDGSARVVQKEGHIVNRIHVADIVRALIASMQSPSPHDIFNLADGHPASTRDVMDYAADLISAPHAERVPLDDPRVSPMARSFYAETKRIDVSRAKTRLGWTPQYDTYRKGLKAILDHGPGSTSRSAS